MTRNNRTRRDIHQEVTDRIIAMLETGTRPWAKGYSGAAFSPMQLPLRVTGEAYKGINVLMLWCTAHEKAYTGRTWMTFRQAKELGGSVRKGEKSTPVVYFQKLAIDDPEHEQADANGQRHIPMLKTFAVFNVDQIDGLPERYTPEPAADHGTAPIAELEAFVQGTGARVIIDGRNPCYAPGPDTIHMPAINRYPEAERYYADLLHELTHWTGHKSRLDRDQKGYRQDREAYAFEELIAELGASFLAAELGTEAEPREDHAAYLASWLKVLKADKRAIFAAAARAQAAADYLQELQQSTAIAA